MLCKEWCNQFGRRSTRVPYSEVACLLRSIRVPWAYPALMCPILDTCPALPWAGPRLGPGLVPGPVPGPVQQPWGRAQDQVHEGWVNQWNAGGTRMAQRFLNWSEHGTAIHFIELFLASERVPLYSLRCQSSYQVTFVSSYVFEQCVVEVVVTRSIFV